MSTIYLDHAATTPLAPEVISKMTHVMNNIYGNPSSIHRFGQDAKLEVDMAREEICSFLNAKPLEICFTSGGTESDNHAIIGACFANDGNHIITAPTEHKAVLNAINYLVENHGYSVSFLSISEDGTIDLNELKFLIKKETVLVSLMYVNNEIGLIHPVEEIGEICKAHNILFHTDAVQAFGKINIDLKNSAIDLLSASSHKIYGPKGAGFTYIRKGTLIDKTVHGGAQEFDMRSGTENVISISGFGEAVKRCKKILDSDFKKISELQAYFIQHIQSEITDIHINGSLENRIYNNVNISFSGCNGEAILHQLNTKGIAVSSGSACTSGSIESSHVIEALNLGSSLTNSAIRFGLGRSTTRDELDTVISSLKNIIQLFRK